MGRVTVFLCSSMPAQTALTIEDLTVRSAVSNVFLCVWGEACLCKAGVSGHLCDCVAKWCVHDYKSARVCVCVCAHYLSLEDDTVY